MTNREGIHFRHYFLPLRFMVTTSMYTVNGISLQVREAGHHGQPPLIFLHGFPEGSFCWEPYLEAAARRGFHALAPDQRGYGESSRPPSIRAYRINCLVEDLRQLVGQLDAGPVCLVGHDWGGAVAWHFAWRYPQLLHRLVIINMPHPEVFRQTLRSSLGQLRRSAYAAFFQLPWLPEKALSLAGYFFLRRTLRRTSQPGTFSKEKLALYGQRWERPGALRAMINWYRAYRFNRERVGKISVPTLLLWGLKDAFLGARMVAPSLAMCASGQLQTWEQGTHWIHHEYRDDVLQAMLAFAEPGVE
jgi:pimeloyl-ACP methyl ester carboxylesterase